jgi:hypothetical protein
VASADLGPSRTTLAAAAGAGLLTLAVGLSRVPLDGLTGKTVPGGPAVDWLVTAIAMVAGATVGTVLAARRPRNPIGWIVLAVFLLLAAPYNQYLVLAYRQQRGLPPLGWIAVAAANAWPVMLALITLMLWAFPDRRLPAGRRRRVPLTLIVTSLVAGLAVSAGLDLNAAAHPIRVDPDGNLINPLPGGIALAADVLLIAILISWVAWLVTQVRVYRRASGEHREQLKWLCGGAVVTVASVLAPGQLVDELISPFGVTALPACIAVAVLKYRLYAIDRIISRVISYAIITAILAGVFAGLVVLATQALPIRTPVAVAFSTLVAAALFNPLRRRIQHAVDRRFNRARYNAEEMVTAFAARLRETVDPTSVTTDLTATVDGAFEPTHISLWLPSHPTP